MLALKCLKMQSEISLAISKPLPFCYYFKSASPVKATIKFVSFIATSQDLLRQTSALLLQCTVKLSVKYFNQSWMNANIVCLTTYLSLLLKWIYLKKIFSSISPSNANVSKYSQDFHDIDMKYQVKFRSISAFFQLRYHNVDIQVDVFMMNSSVDFYTIDSPCHLVLPSRVRLLAIRQHSARHSFLFRASSMSCCSFFLDRIGPALSWSTSKPHPLHQFMERLVFFLLS